MKKTCPFILTILAIAVGMNIWAADASAILQKVEETSSGNLAPRDMEAFMVMKIHQGDSQKTRKLKAWSKNNPEKSDFRLLKFTDPPEVKHIGLLILSEDQMYLYLPEFHRIRRIASSSKKDSFQGSDFSYDDMGFSNYSAYYSPKLISQDEDQWVLELTKKNGVKKPYDKIVLAVDKKTFMPLKMDLYNRSGTLWKQAEYVTKKMSNYHVIDTIRIEDRLNGSHTTLEFKEIKLDQGLDKTIFSQRFLKRRAW